MTLVPINPKNNNDLSLLSNTPDITTNDLIGYDSVATALPKQRAITWGNILAKVLLSLQGVFIQTGDVKASYATALDGWILASGLSIGSPTSGATGRANADVLALYTLLWNNLTNTYLPIQDAYGTPTTRGVSAAADYAANKRLPLPDLRGSALVGADNMGGTSANRITNAGSGIVGSSLGARGGSETKVLITANLPSHSHNYDRTAITAASAATGTDVAIPNALVSTTTNAVGSATPVVTVQPSVITNYFIKL